MKAARVTADQQHAAPQAVPRRMRLLISALLLAHLTVVVATPLAIVPPRSLLAVRITELAAPYLQAGNISHGYAFFAPDPGPSHLIRYELTFDDGRTETGTFPDLARHWPRLRYHRHFMLSEQLSGMAVGDEPPPRPTGDPQLIEMWNLDTAQWKLQHDAFQARAHSYAAHLLNAHGAREVRLHLIRHEIPRREDVLRGQRLDDEQLYSPGPVITQRRREPVEEIP